MDVDRSVTASMLPAAGGGRLSDPRGVISPMSAPHTDLTPTALTDPECAAWCG